MPKTEKLRHLVCECQSNTFYIMTTSEYNDPEKAVEFVCTDCERIFET